MSNEKRNLRRQLARLEKSQERMWKERAAANERATVIKAHLRKDAVDALIKKIEEQVEKHNDKGVITDIISHFYPFTKPTSKVKVKIDEDKKKAIIEALNLNAESLPDIATRFGVNYHSVYFLKQKMNNENRAQLARQEILADTTVST